MTVATVQVTGLSRVGDSSPGWIRMIAPCSDFTAERAENAEVNSSTPPTAPGKSSGIFEVNDPGTLRWIKGIKGSEPLILEIQGL